MKGKVALVTGGTRGIGLATSRALIARGASVMITGRATEDAERAAAGLHDDRAAGVAADVSDRTAMPHAVAECVERFGGLDVVLANAGVAPDLATVSTQPSETFERVIDVDLLGVYRTVDAALPQIIARRGQVVVVSSLYAFINGMGAAAYAMSKAAVEQFGRALRVELSQHGASASVVYFGFVDTDMARTAFDADALAQRLVATPLPRMLLKRVAPERAAEIVLRGIEARRPSIFCPRRWAALAYLRGLVGPLSDARLASEDAVQQVMVELERRDGPVDASEHAEAAPSGGGLRRSPAHTGTARIVG